MPRLTPHDVHVAQTAAEVGVRYKNPDYVAESIFPVVPVEKRSNVVPVYGPSVRYRDEAGQLEPGARVPLSAPDVDLSTYTYNCLEYGYGVPLSCEAQADFDLRVLGLELAVDQLLLARERRVSTIVSTSTNWTSSKTLAGETQWSETETSSPIEDIRLGIKTVADRGLPPNVILFGLETWRALRLHPEIAAIVDSSDLPPAERLARFFEVEEVIIGSALYTESPEGTAEADVAYSPIWGPIAWIGAVNRRVAVDKLLASAGYIFSVGGAIKTRVYTRKAEDDEVAEARETVDELIVAPDAGFLIEGTVA